MSPGRDRRLLLGEWACLGVIYPGSTHGFAVAARLTPEADIGRIWSLSRPLTYRAIAQLRAYRYIAPVGSEPGDAGPNRTILVATRLGRARLRTWLRTPVDHVRDLRSELLLKLELANLCEVDIGTMLIAQRSIIIERVARHDPDSIDNVEWWRHESAVAALRFLDHLIG